MQQTFGLIGKSLSHSFSQKYFNDFFEKEGLQDHKYFNFPIEDESGLEAFLSEHDHLKGFNVTIPYKTAILPFLASLTPEAQEIGAVNAVKNVDGKWKGHNTDGPAFLDSLSDFLPQDFMDSALVMGQGGASRAVQWALAQRGIPFLVVNRASPHSVLQLDPFFLNRFKLIVNTTPLGMYPHTHTAALLPYELLDETFYFYDLVYNPEKTLFLSLGSLHQVHIKNGLDMLWRQAVLSWKFWTKL